MSRSDYRRRSATSISPPPTDDRESTDAGRDHGRRFAGNPHEEKKEEGPSCPSTPLTPRGSGESRLEGTKGSSATVLLSPAKTATTVVTSSSLSPPQASEGEEVKGDWRRRGTKYGDNHDVRYTYLSDAIPREAMSPDDDATVATCSSPGASETTAAAHAGAIISTLPIPLPPLTHLSNNHNLRYYRVVYRGVVALLASPIRHAPRSGVYLSYGEVFATFPAGADDSEECESVAATSTTSLSPRKSGSAAALVGPNLQPESSKPPCLPMLPAKREDEGREGSLDESDPSALRVDYVLTGGYANERNDPTHSASLSHQPQLGFLFTQSANGEPIVERIETTAQLPPPSVSSGPWTYKIVSTSPVPTITGPCPDAPRTAAMLLPGSVHDVSLCFDNQYLRLQHRRGWFRLYRNVTIGGEGGRVTRIPTAELVRIDDVSDPSASAPDSNAADLSMASHSTSSSYSTLNASFASAATATQRHRDRRRRHRPPRRTLEHDRGDAAPHGGPAFPRHVPGVGSTGSTITSPGKHQSQQQQQQQHLDEKCSVSLVSDDEEGESSEQSMLSNDEAVYLMRVLHPKGLKILDAPQYAASHLIHGNRYSSSSSSALPHRVFSTLPPMRSTNYVRFALQNEEASHRRLLRGPKRASTDNGEWGRAGAAFRQDRMGNGPFAGRR
jgi:hypothetical protein